MAGAPQFIPYTTKAGDRWDLLAWRFYGNPTQYSVIIQANPAIPIEAVFEQGLLICVPLIVQNPATSNRTDLPPWK